MLLPSCGCATCRSLAGGGLIFLDRASFAPVQSGAVGGTANALHLSPHRARQKSDSVDMRCGRSAPTAYTETDNRLLRLLSKLRATARALDWPAAHPRTNVNAQHQSAVTCFLARRALGERLWYIHAPIQASGAAPLAKHRARVAAGGRIQRSSLLRRRLAPQALRRAAGRRLVRHVQ